MRARKIEDEWVVETMIPPGIPIFYNRINGSRVYVVAEDCTYLAKEDALEAVDNLSAGRELVLNEVSTRDIPAIGNCEVCGAKEKGLARTYFYYDSKCECHSPCHFDLVDHCRTCFAPIPKETYVTQGGVKNRYLVKAKEPAEYPDYRCKEFREKKELKEEAGMWSWIARFLLSIVIAGVFGEVFRRFIAEDFSRITLLRISTTLFVWGVLFVAMKVLKKIL